MNTTMRTFVTFQSDAFNVTEPRDYFINPGCYGDDLAKWLIARLGAHGIRADAEPGQEDFGWYVLFDVPEGRHCCLLGYRPADELEPGSWFAIVERHRGLIGSILGRRNHGIAAAATAAIHAALTAPVDDVEPKEIRKVRWHLKDDFDHLREELGTPEP